MTTDCRQDPPEKMGVLFREINKITVELIGNSKIYADLVIQSIVDDNWKCERLKN